MGQPSQSICRFRNYAKGEKRVVAIGSDQDKMVVVNPRVVRFEADQGDRHCPQNTIQTKSGQCLSLPAYKRGLPLVVNPHSIDQAQQPLFAQPFRRL